jgi:hypothetical protein
MATSVKLYICIGGLLLAIHFLPSIYSQSFNWICNQRIQKREANFINNDIAMGTFWADLISHFEIMRLIIIMEPKAG